MEIGDRLKEARTRMGMTQEEAAEKIAVSRVAISHWENGRSLPDLASLIRISDLYQISLDELLKGDRKMVEKVKKDSEDLKADRRALILIGILAAIAVIIYFVSLAVGGHFREFCEGALVYVIMGLTFLALIFVYQQKEHSGQ
jgi:transcriptional regulator with XRE-family HTH domain